MKAFFLSDIHIKNPAESNSEKLLGFLQQIHGDSAATHLFLVGDIFDLWIQNHSYFIDRYARIVNVIRALIERGLEVHYFEGNHDLYLRKFWQQDVGARVHEGPLYIQLGPWMVRVEHGDFMNPDDHGYMFLRWLLRTQPVKILASQLPSLLVAAIGERASRVSRYYTSHQKALSQDSTLKFMRDYAMAAVREKAFNFFVAGHTHVCDTYAFKYEQRPVTAFNLGSWFDEQKALVITDQHATFLTI